MRPAQKRERSASSRSKSGSAVRAMAQGDLFDKADEMIDLDRRAVELDDAAEPRRRADSPAWTKSSAASIAGRSIISMPPGMMPAAMMSATQAPAASLESKAISSARAIPALRQNAHGDFGHDAEQPSEPAMSAEQIVARRRRDGAPPSRTISPVIRTNLDAQHIVGGEAVFQAMHAARILRHIAADRAGDLPGRIGRVIEARPPRPRG